MAAMTAMPMSRRNPPLLLEALEDGGVLRLTLNRPQARNALSVGLMQALLEALGRAAERSAHSGRGDRRRWARVLRRA